MHATYTSDTIAALTGLAYTLSDVRKVDHGLMPESECPFCRDNARYYVAKLMEHNGGTALEWMDRARALANRRFFKSDRLPDRIKPSQIGIAA